MLGIFKKPKQVVVTRKIEICNECGGYGGWYSYFEQENVKCPECNGKGKTEREIHNYKY